MLIRASLGTLLAAAAVSLAAVPAAFAQQGLTSALAQQASTNPNANMVVKAREMIYDNDHDTVVAVGNVQIYYDSRTLQADRVTYDRKSARVRAVGNVKITEADGTVSYADTFDLTDDFRDGFVNSVRVVTTDETYFAARRAERTDGNITVFQNGVYTACVPCMENPQKPPLWQIKAMKVIHNDQEKMLYFEDATFEFLGMPIAYLPYMSSPDPSVKRKSGILSPSYIASSELGMGVSVPYFFNLAPNYDLTLTPGFTTRQGPMASAEWRHRLLTGSYTILASGVFQQDPDAFASENIGSRDFRGSLNSKGEFWLNERWKWGWDGTLVTDKYFIRDYNIDLDQRPTEITSTLYLTGQGDKSWFDARMYYFLGLTKYDRQKEQPVVHPVVDYDYIVDQPVLGGELGWNINLTSLTRQQADFDKIAGFGNPLITCDGLSAASTPRADCVQRGIDGTYTRMSANLYWKKTITDSLGQQWTPFAYLRGDLAWTDLDNGGAPVQFVNANDEFLARAVPAIGLEYRYPFIAEMSWGSQILEPIGQVILRPRLQQTGTLPNEDSQSLLFDDTNLFEWNKFSGWDRLEDGSRVNYGLQYTLTTNGGMYFNAMFGQSYAFGATNPYSDGDMANVGLESGLDTRLSDYVARVYFQPFQNFGITSGARFDQDSWELRRLEVGATGTAGRLKADITYGQYDAQPLLGLDKREGVQGRTALRVSEHWIATGGGVYDITQKRFSSRYVGMSYLDECIALGVKVASSYDETNDKTDTSVSFQLTLRGLGESGTPKEFADRVWNKGFNN